jgi:uncharacterized protein YbbK (DUF523 family)/uncharacterized protein YbgA (DUF1722 family)
MTRTAQTNDSRAPSARSLGERPRLGVSACLLGEAVRYDGGHKAQQPLIDDWSALVSWVPICPEVELGLGVPRPTMRLVQERGRLRLLMPDRNLDLTTAMDRWARRRLRGLLDRLDGYLFKARSPSCGVWRVPVYAAPCSERPRAATSGAFARVALELCPTLPLEEEGGLAESVRRQAFLERVFARVRWREMIAHRHSRSRLEAFHRAHELELHAHGRDSYMRVGAALAHALPLSLPQHYERYETAFASAMLQKATPVRQAAVLRRALQTLRRWSPNVRLDRLERAVERYRAGSEAPWLIRSQIGALARRVSCHPLLEQVYLFPRAYQRELSELGWWSSDQTPVENCGRGRPLAGVDSGD